MPRICSISSSTLGSVGCSANTLPCPHLLGVNLLERRALLEPRDLPLRRVLLGDREERRRADLVCDRLHPFDQLFETCTRRDRLAALQIEELAGQAVANRPPHVLLEEPVR